MSNDLDLAEETQELSKLFKKYPKLKGKVRDSNYNKETGYLALGQHFYYVDLEDVLKIIGVKNE